MYKQWLNGRRLSAAMKYKCKEVSKTDGNMERFWGLNGQQRLYSEVKKKRKKNIVFWCLQPYEKNRRRHNLFPVFLIIEIDHIPTPTPPHFTPLPFLFANISSLLWIFPYLLFPFFHSIRKEVCRCYCSWNIVSSGFLRGFHRKWWDSY